MGSIEQAFRKNNEAGKVTLIPFLTIGDPDLDTSVEIIARMEQAGADIIELGVPYSDPLADGPVIQRSSLRALQHKVTILDVIQTARKCRDKGVKLPFILFTYFNPVLQTGLERFFGLLVENGINGIIIPDLPVEENAEVLALAKAHQIDLVPLVAPTSRERISKIAETAMGFIYCVSSLGVTGTRTDFFSGINAFLDDVRKSTELPIAVGFGISSREHVARFAEFSDGAVVGSAIVKTIEQAIPLLESPQTREQGLAQISDFVKELKG